MPPKPAGRGQHLQRGSQASIGGAAELSNNTMAPPPIPGVDKKPNIAGQGGNNNNSDVQQLAGKILGAETLLLKKSLMDSGIALAQIIAYYTDVHKLKMQRHATNPPMEASASWKRNIEQYNDVLDSMEAQITKAIAILEAEVVAQKEAAAAQANKVLVEEPDSMMVDANETSPVKQEPQDGNLLSAESATSSTTGLKQTGVPGGPIPSGAAVPNLQMPKRAGSISLASLNRPNRPAHGLRLDLSAVRSIPDSALPGGAGDNAAAEGKAGPTSNEAIQNIGLTGIDPPIASPIMLAPKSAKPKAELDNEFLMEGLNDFVMFNSDPQSLVGDGTGMGIVGDGTAENPLEIDDLFGDKEAGPMTGNMDASTGMDDSLFSASSDMFPTQTLVAADPLSLPTSTQPEPSTNPLRPQEAANDNTGTVDIAAIESIGVNVERPPNITPELSTLPQTAQRFDPNQLSAPAFQAFGGLQNSLNPQAQNELISRLQSERLRQQQRQQFGLGIGSAAPMSLNMNMQNMNPFAPGYPGLGTAGGLGRGAPGAGLPSGFPPGGLAGGYGAQHPNMNALAALLGRPGGDAAMARLRAQFQARQIGQMQPQQQQQQQQHQQQQQQQNSIGGINFAPGGLNPSQNMGQQVLDPSFNHFMNMFGGGDSSGSGAGGNP